MSKRNYYMLESGMPFRSTWELTEDTVVKEVVERSEAEMTLRARDAGDPWELVNDKNKHLILRIGGKWSKTSLGIANMIVPKSKYGSNDRHGGEGERTSCGIHCEYFQSSCILGYWLPAFF